MLEPYFSYVRPIALQWIPPCSVVPESERVDTLAKDGALSDQPQSNISYEEVAVTKTLMNSRPTRYDYQLLDRQEQFIVARIRTRYNMR